MFSGMATSNFGTVAVIALQLIVGTLAGGEAPAAMSTTGPVSKCHTPISLCLSLESSVCPRGVHVERAVVSRGSASYSEACKLAYPYMITVGHGTPYDLGWVTLPVSCGIACGFLIAGRGYGLRILALDPPIGSF
jgi:hypothetical protein